MLDFLVEYGYWGLLFASFLSATVLPFSSEAVLSGLLLCGTSPFLCILCATIGNTLGGLTCYWLGSCGKVDWLERYMGVSMEKVERMKGWVRRYGAVVAFFSFLPVVGDLLVVALGFMRAHWAGVTLFMCLGKFLRYLVCWLLTYYFMGAF